MEFTSLKLRSTAFDLSFAVRRSYGDIRCAVLAAAAAGAARRPRTAVHAGPGYRGQAAGGRCGRRATATRGTRFCLEKIQFVGISLVAGAVA